MARSRNRRRRGAFAQLVRREDVTLAYVTGRHRALIEQAMREYDLPQPDYVIADVGATIYQVDAADWQQWRGMGRADRSRTGAI